LTDSEDKTPAALDGYRQFLRFLEGGPKRAPRLYGGELEKNGPPPALPRVVAPPPAEAPVPPRPIRQVEMDWQSKAAGEEAEEIRDDQIE